MGNTLGNRGEAAAATYLQNNGYEILAQHVTLWAGEIDIVALAPNRELVIVEVKTRASQRFGSSVESISRKKKRALRRSIGLLLQKMSWRGAWRVDVIGIDLTGATIARLRHIQNISLS